MNKPKLKKKSLDFTSEDMKIIDTLRRGMEATQGRVSLVAVIRSAIRKAAAK
jgi:hypothetical protein